MTQNCRFIYLFLSDSFVIFVENTVKAESNISNIEITDFQ